MEQSMEDSQHTKPTNPEQDSQKRKKQSKKKSDKKVPKDNGEISQVFIHCSLLSYYHSPNPDRNLSPN